MTKLRPAFKIHGGKYYLASWVVRKFPEGYENLDYIEPFSGAASVLLNKNPTVKPVVEILNDLHGGVAAIHKTLRDESEAFIKKLRNITYSELVFTLSNSIDRTLRSRATSISPSTNSSFAE